MEGEIIRQTAPTLLVGDVWVNIWSDHYPRADFLQVLKISPTGKTVICIRIDKEQVDVDTVRPNYMRYGEQFRMDVKRSKGVLVLRGTYPGYGGLTRFGQFWKYEGGEVYEPPISLHPWSVLDA